MTVFIHHHQFHFYLQPLYNKSRQLLLSVSVRVEQD